MFVFSLKRQPRSAAETTSTFPSGMTPARHRCNEVSRYSADRSSDSTSCVSHWSHPHQCNPSFLHCHFDTSSSSGAELLLRFPSPPVECIILPLPQRQQQQQQQRSKEQRELVLHDASAKSSILHSPLWIASFLHCRESNRISSIAGKSSETLCLRISAKSSILRPR